MVHSRPVYALVAVVLPTAWGLVVYLASNAIQAAVRRHGGKRGGDDTSAGMTPPDYYI